MPADRRPLSTVEALAALRSRFGLVLLCAVVVAGSAFGFAQTREKQYTATADLRFDEQPPSAAQFTALSEGRRTIPVSVSTNSEAALRLSVVAATATALGIGRVALEGGLSFKEGADFTRVEVSATGSSPDVAATTANAYARRYVAFQNDRNRRLATAGLARLRQLRGEAIGGSAFAADATVLRTISRDRYGGVALAVAASPPSSPSSPDLTRDVLVGLAAGLLLGAALALALDSRGSAASAEETRGIGRWGGRPADA